MRVRRFAEFLYDFPDDQIEDDQDIVVFGGRGLTEVIAEMIRGLGYQVSGPENEDFEGWSLTVRGGGRRFWLRFSDLRPRGILVTADMTFWPWRWARQAYADFSLELDAELRRDGRFREIKWFFDVRSPDEIPSDRPVDD